MIAWLLIGLSISISPFSASQHFYKTNPAAFANDDYGGKEIARPFGAQLTIHPQLIVSAYDDYWQASGGVILYDTEGKLTFPLLAGPAYKGFGLMLGGMFRESHFPPSHASVKVGPRVFYSTGENYPGYEIAPLIGLSYLQEFKFLTLQVFLNHQLINLGVGIKIL